MAKREPSRRGISGANNHRRKPDARDPQASVVLPPDPDERTQAIYAEAIANARPHPEAPSPANGVVGLANALTSSIGLMRLCDLEPRWSVGGSLRWVFSLDALWAATAREYVTHRRVIDMAWGDREFECAGAHGVPVHVALTLAERVLGELAVLVAHNGGSNFDLVMRVAGPNASAMPLEFWYRGLAPSIGTRIELKRVPSESDLSRLHAKLDRLVDLIPVSNERFTDRPPLNTGVPRPTQKEMIDATGVTGKHGGISVTLFQTLVKESGIDLTKNGAKGRRFYQHEVRALIDAGHQRHTVGDLLEAAWAKWASPRSQQMQAKPT